MASSPDTKNYVDLTIYDEDVVTILNDILSTGRGLIPEWTPQVGQIELTLAEMFAVRSAEVVNSINRLPSAVVEVLLQLFGLTRSDGSKATATVKINFSDSDSVVRTLPAGTQFLFVNAVTNVSYIFSLDEDFSLSPSSPTPLEGTAQVTALTIGEQYNFSADGQPLSLLTVATFVESVTFDTSPSNGRNAEADQDYFNRGINLLSSYTTAATTAEQVKFYVASNKTYANRVEVYNRRRYRDRDTTSDSYGLHDGVILLVVGDTVSNQSVASTELPVSPSNLNDLYTSVTERTPIGLTVDVMSAELAEIDVVAVVNKKSAYSASAVKTAVETAVQEYLNPNVWDFNLQSVRRNELIALMDAVEGVDYVSSLELNAKSLIGSNNVGYFDFIGGSSASFTVNIAGAAVSTTYAAGDASIFFVDSSDASAVPVVYMFENSEFTTDGSGNASTVEFTAKAVGLDYNDSSNEGVIPTSTTGWIPVSGDWVGSTIGAITFSSTSAISGGSNASESFVAIDSDTDDNVTSDLTLKNLGTLATYGTVNITIT